MANLVADDGRAGRVAREHAALAEALGCSLVTADARLASVPGIRCRVERLAS